MRITKDNQHRGYLDGIFWFILSSLILTGTSNSLHAQNIDIHGFISQGYLKSGKNNYVAHTKKGTWEYAEIGINFSTNASDELYIGMQLFTRSLGKLGKFALELDWAFGDYAVTNSFGIQVGRIKTPYGLYGETQDIDLVRATVLLPQSVYFLALRDILMSFNGFSLYGNLEMGNLGNFDYQLFAGAVIGFPAQSKDSSVAQFLNQRGYISLKDLKIHAFKIQHSRDKWAAGGALQYNPPLEELLIKSTILFHKAQFDGLLTQEFFSQIQLLAQGDSNLSREFTFSTDNIVFWVASMEFTWNEFIIASEYARYFGTFRSSAPSIVAHSTLQHERWYAQLTYAFTDWLQAAIYFASITDPTDRDGAKAKNTHPNKKTYNAFQHDYTLSFRFDINEFWIFKIEGHLLDGTFQVYEALNSNQSHLERYWYLIAAKTTLTF